MEKELENNLDALTELIGEDRASLFNLEIGVFRRLRGLAYPPFTQFDPPKSGLAIDLRLRLAILTKWGAAG